MNERLNLVLLLVFLTYLVFEGSGRMQGKSMNERERGKDSSKGTLRPNYQRIIHFV